MISAVVFCSPSGTCSRSGGHPAEALVRSLAVLVPTTVSGLVRDVIIAGPAGTDLPQIADHAGCLAIEAAREADWLAGAVAAARQPQVLILQAGWAPEEGFATELEDRLAMHDGRTSVICAMADGSALRFLRRAAVVAVLASRARCGSAGEGADFPTLVRALRPHRVLRSRARPT